MKIRTYQTKDEEKLIFLWNLCHLTVPWNDPKKDINRKMDENPDLFFVGEIEEQLIASCMAGYDGHRGWIYYLAVHPEYRNKGWARKIVMFAEGRLKSIGCPKVNLMVRDTNTAVIDFYKNIGYADDPVCVLSKRLENDG